MLWLCYSLIGCLKAAFFKTFSQFFPTWGSENEAGGKGLPGILWRTGFLILNLVVSISSFELEFLLF